VRRASSSQKRLQNCPGAGFCSGFQNEDIMSANSRLAAHFIVQMVNLTVQLKARFARASLGLMACLAPFAMELRKS
jgi:hypothetical protein